MSLTAAIVRGLVDAGLTGDALVNACARIEAASAPAGRSSAAVRQDRYRKRKAAEASQVTSRDVTTVTAPQLIPLAAAGPKTLRAKRASRLPPDWEPDEDLRAYARERLPDNRTCHHETAKFKEHWASSGGSNATKIDWRAAYRKWILTASERYGEAPPQGGLSFNDRPGFAGRMNPPRPQRKSLVEGLREVMEMIPDDE